MTFTKALIPAVLAATLGTAAMAEGEFLYQEMDVEGPTTMISIEGVTTDSAGFVAIYDFSTGEIGDLLGTAPVNAGANADVNVNLDAPAQLDVIAVLYEGPVTEPSMASATLEINIDL